MPIVCFSFNQYYLRARYYNQATGRFTQMDTWMGNHSDPITLHKYLYAGIDPALMVDPSGNNFTIGGMMSAVNVMASLASAATAGYRFGQIITGEREVSAKEVGMTLLIAAAGPAAGKLATMFYGRLAVTSAGGLAAGVIKLNVGAIKKAVAGSGYRTQQSSVSIPRIESYVKGMLNGDQFPPIKVDGNVIVDGHHRYIAIKDSG